MRAFLIFLGIFFNQANLELQGRRRLPYWIAYPRGKPELPENQNSAATPSPGKLGYKHRSISNIGLMKSSAKISTFHNTNKIIRRNKRTFEKANFLNAEEVVSISTASTRGEINPTSGETTKASGTPDKNAAADWFKSMKEIGESLQSVAKLIATAFSSYQYSDESSNQLAGNEEVLKDLITQQNSLAEFERNLSKLVSKEKYSSSEIQQAKVGKKSRSWSRPNNRKNKTKLKNPPKLQPSAILNLSAIIPPKTTVTTEASSTTQGHKTKGKKGKHHRNNHFAIIILNDET